MKLSIADNPETIGYLGAQRLLQEIESFKKSDAKPFFKVGLSSGRTMDRVYSSFVELIKMRLKNNEQIPNLSDVQFVQTEAFFPEDPNSETSIMAKQIAEKFVKPLQELTGQEVNVFYPGEEDDVAEMRKKFIDLTKNLDVNFVTLHESGAAKGLRDADLINGETKPRWTQGRMHTREIQLRKIDKIRAGEEIAEFDMQRTEGEKPLSDVMNKITESIKAKDESMVPQYFVTEGYNAYRDAQKVIMITEGFNKATAVKRVLSNIKLAEMSEETKKDVTRKRNISKEGRVSGSTVINLREGRGIEFIIDDNAAKEIDEKELMDKGVEIKHITRENKELGREFGNEFSWHLK